MRDCLGPCLSWGKTYNTHCPGVSGNVDKRLHYGVIWDIIGGVERLKRTGRFSRGPSLVSVPFHKDA